jgi:signal transduction histidine kinase
VLLRWAFAQLQAINRELEQRVADRTKELRTANQELNQAMIELKDAQDQIVMQEKMASVGMLTTGIAHEIKNPLNFINNFSDISVDLVKEIGEELATVKDKIGDDTFGYINDIMTDLKTNCSKIKEHGIRADNIVKTMLMHSQGAAVQKEPVDIPHLMDDNIQITSEAFRAAHNQFQAKIDKHYGQIDKVVAAAELIGRVFSYIIDNALYAVNEKKQTAPADYQPTIDISIQTEGENAVIKIKDNGTGIPKQLINKVFEPFYTTKPTGKGNTGLGLSICYDTVVKQHKGDLRVASEEGVFTEFTISLPINPKAAA